MHVSEKDVSGTSFHGDTINASIKELTKILGKPTYETKSIKEKVNFEWVLETSNGKVVTLYTWKEYRRFKKSEVVNLHIGGFEKSDTSIAKGELEFLLNLKK